MSLIHIEKASKYYTMGEETIKALDDVLLDYRSWRVRSYYGAVRFRQINAYEHHRVFGYCR
jgi:putative ABC transport system ATP-binding protein